MTCYEFLYQFTILYSLYISILMYINKYHNSTLLYTTTSTLPDTSVGCMPTHNHKLCDSIDKMPTTSSVVVIPDLYEDTPDIGAVAQWIRRLTSDQETVGSSPTGVKHFLYCYIYSRGLIFIASAISQACYTICSPNVHALYISSPTL